VFSAVLAPTVSPSPEASISPSPAPGSSPVSNPIFPCIFGSCCAYCCCTQRIKNHVLWLKIALLKGMPLSSQAMLKHVIELEI